MRPSDSPARRAPLRRGLRPGSGTGRHGLPARTAPRARRPRPRRNAGLIGVSPSRAVGTVAGPERLARLPMEIATRMTRWSPVRRRGCPNRRSRSRWRRDRCGPVLTATSVPLRSDQPARGRLGSGPAAPDRAGAARGAWRGRAAGTRAAAVLATSCRRRPGCLRKLPRSRPRAGRVGGLLVVVAARSTWCPPPRPDLHRHQAPERTVRVRTAVDSAVRWCCKAAS